MIDVSEHLGLAQRIAWDFYPKIQKKYEFEDILQVAYVGLTKAGNSFDENRGIKFSTYAFPKIRGELIRFLKDDKRYNISRGVPHNLVMASYETERENGSLESRIGNDGIEEKLIVRVDLNQAIKKFSINERKVLKMYYLNDLHQREIADIMNITQNQVSRVKRRIVKKLRESLQLNACEKVAM